MLSEAFLKKLDALSVLLSRPAQGGAGARRSRALGSSVEFSDFRDYVSGDDLRRVDWNAAARFDKLFIKLFMEEKQTCVTVLLDASASMASEKEKWDTAVDLALTLCYLALRGGDTARLIALCDARTLQTPLLSGRPDYMKAQAFAAALSPAGQVLLGRNVPRLSLPQRGACILISDFLSEDGYERALNALLYARQETAALQVLSAGELAPQLEGPLRLVDGETAEALEIEAGPHALSAYQETLHHFLNGLSDFCHARGIHRALLDTRDDFDATVLTALSQAGLIG